ncbi:MAG: hypothetical protein CMM10_10685 [Rhodospirillaceae bacterium]|nr:hypothetical protein [Rhodospirillaceae bacterium]
MDFQLSEEQRAFKEVARKFCQKEVPPVLAERAKTPEESAKVPLVVAMAPQLEELGIRNLTVPEKYGGLGQGFLTAAMLSEEFAYSGFPQVTTNWKWCLDFAAMASPELQDEFFPELVDNIAFCGGASMTEPSAIEDTHLPYNEPGAGIRTFAERDGDEWVINGGKAFCTTAASATHYILYARTVKDKPLTESVSAFLFPTDTEGFSIVRLNEFMGEPPDYNADTALDDARIPERYLLGELNKGYPCLGRLSRASIIVHHAGIIGAMQQMYEYTLDFTRGYVQGGKPIFEHKNVGPLIMEMAVQIESLRLVTYRAAWEYDQSDRTQLNPMYFDIANALQKSVQMKVITNLLEACGNAAVIKDHPFEKFIRKMMISLHSGSARNMNLIRLMQVADDLRPTGAL